MVKTADTYHVPVLLKQSIDGLNIKPGGIYIDVTFGGGGHSREILKRINGNGQLYSFDQDEDAEKNVNNIIAELSNDGATSTDGNCGLTFVRSNFRYLKNWMRYYGIDHIDGLLADLGVSSHHFDDETRGFSFRFDAPLDMRMSQSGTTAAELVNTLPAGELRRILSVYGEEKFAGAIVNGIVKARAEKPIETTLELAEIIKENVPQRVRRDGHPARKSFQALRIAVNDELGVLERGLDGAFELLGSGGRLAVITFHSLEDRIVKQKMASWCQGCTCPKDFPVCVCGNKPKAKLVVRKPVCANETELRNNPRARSAKLRICEKI